MSAPQATPCPECGDKGWLLTGGHPEGERIVPCPSCCGGSGTAASDTQWCDCPAHESVDPLAPVCPHLGGFIDPSQCVPSCRHPYAAPAAEPDNLVARLREGVVPNGRWLPLLAEAADRIEAADAIIKFDAEYSRDQFIEHDAIRAENERLRAERDAALGRIAELEAILDGYSTITRRDL